MSKPVIRTTPSLKIGLNEPAGIEICCRTVFVVGLIRLSVPFLSVTIQTLSAPAVIPPSGPGGAMGSVALIVFLTASIRTSAGFLPQSGAQMLPNPDARPEQASPDTPTLAMILFVAGSTRSMALGFVLAIQTASPVTTTQSAVPPTLILADGLRSYMAPELPSPLALERPLAGWKIALWWSRMRLPA